MGIDWVITGYIVGELTIVLELCSCLKYEDREILSCMSDFYIRLGEDSSLVTITPVDEPYRLVQTSFYTE